MPEIGEELVRYLAARDAQRNDHVTRILGALSERERQLVCEAAVMGYVLGSLGATPPKKAPKDLTIVWRVIDACRAEADLYPLIGGRTDENETEGD